MIDLTADEVRALLARCCAPLRGIDPEEAGLSPSVREHRVVEAHYCSAFDKLMAARRETI